MGAEVELATAANGAVTNADVLRGLAVSIASEPRIVKLAEGVHSVVGLAAFNVAVIEGETGLIVYDTGDGMEDGRRVLDMVRTISRKPIAAVMYSHSHYSHGAKAIIGEQRDIAIVGHPKVNRIVEAGAGSAIPGVFAELGPLYMARAAEQLANFLPDDGPDAAVGPKITFKESGFVSVNRTVADGEEFVLDGIRMQAFTEFWSDEDACLTVLLPDHGVVLNNLYWPFMPNLYPLRGDAFRDPRIWRDGIKLIRDLRPKALHNVNGVPLIGQDAVHDALNDYMDGITFVFDQTLRGMLKGLDPDELRSFVRLPKHLEDLPQLAQLYGEVDFYPPRIYGEAVGWFDRDAADIFPPSATLEAERIVDGFGGREAVIRAVEVALDKGEHAWAARQQRDDRKRQGEASAERAVAGAGGHRAGPRGEARTGRRARTVERAVGELIDSPHGFLLLPPDLPGAADQARPEPRSRPEAASDET
jgi:alkyl sulfatase BDS1-like metallo-beta-lactamase superfamily hydrolase